MPIIWHITRPPKPQRSFNPLFLTRSETPQSNTKSINPKINPPLAPNSTCTPPLNPEKTGTPTVPNSTYVIIEARPHLTPKTYPQRATAKVCRVRETWVGIGIAICEQTTVSAVNNAAVTRLKVLFFADSFISFVPLRVFWYIIHP